MNKIRVLKSLLIHLFVLTACSTTNNVKLFTPQIAADNQAVVYIYRPSAISNMMYSPDLYINNEFKLSIKNGKKTPLLLTPGEYKFELEAEKNDSALNLFSLNLSAGSTTFIRVDTSLKIKSAVTYEPYQRSFKLTRVDEQRAKKEIAECCMVENRKSKTSQETTTVKKQTEDGFSVDKTQNPFSH